MLNIAMISFNMMGRGTYQRAYFLASELAKKGHQVTLLATNSTGSSIEETVSNSVKIVTFPRLLKKHYLSGWGLYEAELRKAWIKNKSFDIVHAFEMRPTCIYPSLSATHKGSILVSDWADWLGKGGSVEQRPNVLFRNVLRPFETYFENHFRPSAQGITVICRTLYEKSQRLGVDQRKILYLPNGFDNPYLTSFDLDYARSSLNFSPKDFMIGYIGSAFKTDMDLMEASIKILSEDIPNVKLLHVGRSKYFSKEKSGIIQISNLDNIEMSLYLSACNLFWLPFQNTNANAGRLPLKLSDYLTIGRPVVSTSIGDIPDLINKYEFGLIASDNPRNIAEKVYTIYSNPDLQRTMSENGMMLSKSNKENWTARASALEDFYKFLLKH